MTVLRGLDLQTGFFTIKQIKAATNNFDPVNKIGEGGFGSVFKVPQNSIFLSFNMLGFIQLLSLLIGILS